MDTHTETLTREQIEHMPAGREMDALVAERLHPRHAREGQVTEAEDLKRLAVGVMGWPLAHHSEHERIGWAVGGKGAPLAYVTADDVLCVIDCEGGWSNRWNPFKDANADVQVLERVRSTWEPERFSDFVNEVEALGIEEADDATLDRLDHPSLAYRSAVQILTVYKVGHYARAALATLDKEP